MSLCYNYSKVERVVKESFVAYFLSCFSLECLILNSHHRLNHSSSRFEKSRVSQSVNRFYRILASTLWSISYPFVSKLILFYVILSTVVLEARKVVRSSSRCWRTSWWKSIPRGRDLLLVCSCRNEHGIVLGTKVPGLGNFNWPAVAKKSQLCRNVKFSNSFL